MPVHAKLDLSLAGRVDHYSDASSISSRPSGQIKFLYSPTDWLKVRGGYSQTFRAPDMFNLYGESDAFAAGGRLLGAGLLRRRGLCLRHQHDRHDAPSGHRARPRNMATTTASASSGSRSSTSPTTLDWYRINLEDLVVTESAYDLLLREWQCDNGELEGSSQLCADVRSRITRNGFGAVEHVIVQPINQDSMEREGVDLRANFNYESEKLGQFSAGLFYSKVLKFELNSFEGDESIDLRYGWQGQSTPENCHER